jgi:molybdopterin molybdotransferase
MRLAQDVTAACDLPPFDNSAMDGYAVRARETAPVPIDLPVLQTIAAGEVAVGNLPEGAAARIMTGAPLPPGADAVIMREQTEESGDRVKLLETPEVGQHVRRRGEDVQAGTLLLPAGTRLRAFEVGLLAAQGHSMVSAIPRPRVAVVTSGDELVSHGETPGPGQIRDSNSPALMSALREWGFRPVHAGCLADDREALRRGLEDALKDADALLVTGGVSVGDFDYTREALDSLGFVEKLWRIKIKPGKPLLFGLLQGKPVFGLPGNPLSAWVTSRVFAIPALEKMAGRRVLRDDFPERGRLTRSFSKREGLRQYLFCRAERTPSGSRLTVMEPQGSARLALASGANALAVGEIGLDCLAVDHEVAFQWL